MKRMKAHIRYHGDGECPELVVASVQNGTKTLQSKEFYVYDFEDTESMIDEILGYFTDFGILNLKKDLYQDMKMFPMDYRPDLVDVN